MEKDHLIMAQCVVSLYHSFDHKINHIYMMTTTLTWHATPKLSTTDFQYGDRLILFLADRLENYLKGMHSSYYYDFTLYNYNICNNFSSWHTLLNVSMFIFLLILKT